MELFTSEEMASTKTVEKPRIALLQHNYLVRSPLSFTYMEARIFTFMLAQIPFKAKALPEIAIRISDMLTHRPTPRVYQSIKDACQRLFDKEINLLRIDSKKNDFHKCRIVDSLEWDTGSGYIRGTFGTKIAPYLVDLKAFFTEGELEHLLTIKSGYTYKLYWLLKSYESKGAEEMAFEELRTLVIGDEQGKKYSSWSDFRKFVLEPAVEEITSGELMDVTYTTTMKGKKVATVIFSFDGVKKDIADKRKAEREANNPSPAGFNASLPKDVFGESDEPINTMTMTTEQFACYERLVKYGVTQWQADKVVRHCSIPLELVHKTYIYPALPDVRKAANLKPFKNLGIELWTQLKPLLHPESGVSVHPTIEKIIS